MSSYLVALTLDALVHWSCNQCKFWSARMQCSVQLSHITAILLHHRGVLQLIAGPASAPLTGTVCRQYKLVAAQGESAVFPGSYVNSQTLIRLQEITMDCETFVQWTVDWDAEPEASPARARSRLGPAVPD